MTSNVIFSSEQNQPLVEAFGSLLGCMNCEWRNSKRCPNFVEGQDFVVPPNGICDSRILWIRGFLPRYDKFPSIDQLMLDLSKSFQSYRERVEFKDLIELEEQLREANDSKDFVEADRLEELLDKRKKEFRAVSELVSKLRDRQVDRDTPKKVEVDVTRTIPLNQLHRIMSDEPLDGEFEEVKD